MSADVSWNFLRVPSTSWAYTATPASGTCTIIGPYAYVDSTFAEFPELAPTAALAALPVDVITTEVEAASGHPVLLSGFTTMLSIVTPLTAAKVIAPFAPTTHAPAVCRLVTATLIPASAAASAWTDARVDVVTLIALVVAAMIVTARITVTAITPTTAIRALPRSSRFMHQFFKEYMRVTLQSLRRADGGWRQW